MTDEKPYWVMRCYEVLLGGEGYLLSFDPDGKRGFGDVRLTTDIKQAKRFDSVEAVFLEWTRASTVRPIRNDGNPNKPLTAYSIQPEMVKP